MSKLTFIGYNAMRRAFLKSAIKHSWDYSKISADLLLSGNVYREAMRLAPVEYLEAKKQGLIREGRRNGSSPRPSRKPKDGTK